MKNKITIISTIRALTDLYMTNIQNLRKYGYSDKDMKEIVIQSSCDIFSSCIATSIKASSLPKEKIIQQFMDIAKAMVEDILEDMQEIDG